MRVHFVGNAYREDALAAVVDTAHWLKSKGIAAAVDTETGRHVKLPVVSSVEFGDADLAVAFGGDGTLIRAAHLCAVSGTPILGVYFGRFGFVTQCTGENVRSCIQSYLDGAAIIEDRMMLQAFLSRADQEIAEIHALNEIVLQRDVTARMMTFEVAVDGHNLTRYPADGVLISTPTGSTGYNLSAGGPIIDPTVEALVLTAVAPHTLSARTMILRSDSTIHLTVGSRGDAVLSADGQTRLHILSGDQIRVTRSPRVTRLVKIDKYDFLIKLGQRLFAGQGMLGDTN
ncbi:MAG: NAD(+)/NADH kinase [Fimbriimonas sp.]|nr:NAD(+)/NADH kinase [Fimbriimonas sp.]